MSYNASIPLITDKILVSSRQIRANFQAINSTFGANHAGLTQDASIAGMHDVLVLRPQAADPVTSATQTAIYNKLVSTIPQLFYRPNNSQTPIQMTSQYLSTGLTAPDTETYLPQQYSFVAGPFIIYGGFLKGPFTKGQGIALTPGTTLLYVDMIM